VCQVDVNANPPKNLAVCTGRDAAALTVLLHSVFVLFLELLWLLWLLFVIVINIIIIIIIIMFCKLIPVFHNQYYTFYIIKK